MKRKHKSRVAFYNFHTKQQWGNAANYNLSINSGKIGIEQTVEVIMTYINAVALEKLQIQ